MQANLGIPPGSSRDSPIFVLYFQEGWAGVGECQKEKGRRGKRDEDSSEIRDGDGYVF